MEAARASRLPVGTINREFLNAGGSVAEYSGAAVNAAVGRGLITLHPSAPIWFSRKPGRSCLRNRNKPLLEKLKIQAH
jgi:hypothetical protein